MGRVSDPFCLAPVQRWSWMSRGGEECSRLEPRAKVGFNLFPARARARRRNLGEGRPWRHARSAARNLVPTISCSMLVRGTCNLDEWYGFLYASECLDLSSMPASEQRNATFKLLD